VRAFFQGSLARADLATAVGYPVQGSGSEATVETVRAALNPPVNADNGLCTGHILALHPLLMAKKGPEINGPPGIFPANKVLNTHAQARVHAQIDLACPLFALLDAA
jgi:hypothetical protein